MSPTLLDVARGNRFLYGPSGDVVATVPRGHLEQSELLPVIEALTLRNNFLQDVPWQARISQILDHKGRPYLIEVEVK